LMAAGLLPWQASALVQARLDELARRAWIIEGIGGFVAIVGLLMILFAPAGMSGEDSKDYMEFAFLPFFVGVCLVGIGAWRLLHLPEKA
jgi:hypothetical protein